MRYRLPLGSSTSRVAGGVMVTYGQNAFRSGELAAGLAHEIFQGNSPASLPVEITDFFLGINLKTADTIGIDISDDILHVADIIIRP
ncbi:ABC transporter substrate binding protein [Thermodesulfobacteriota bacterium]